MYAVYIREAHPNDGWKMESNDRFGINLAQPKTAASRTLVASQCAKKLALPMTMLVDTIDDEINRAYSGFPDRLYLIDTEGRVVYKGGRGPFGFKPNELEQQIALLLLDAALQKSPQAPKANSTTSVVPTSSAPASAVSGQKSSPAAKPSAPPSEKPKANETKDAAEKPEPAKPKAKPKELIFE